MNTDISGKQNALIHLLNNNSIVKCLSAASNAPQPLESVSIRVIRGFHPPARLFQVRNLSFVAMPSFGQAFLLLALVALCCSCASPGRLRGGRASTSPRPLGGLTQTLVQGDDASQPSKQNQDTIRVRNYTLPAGSRFEESRLEPCPSNPPVTNTQSVLLSAAMPVVEREETHASTELGAAQKNSARELSAKLSSLKGVVWVGLGLFVFGLASLVWPPLKAAIGSVTTSAALILGGIALILLPTMVAGNELLILAGVALVTGAWFLAHRHGQLRGLVTAAAKNPKSEARNPKQI
jgi:hypothetical protein